MIPLSKLSGGRVAVITLGTTIAGGGMVHLFVHVGLGSHDWITLTLILSGMACALIGAGFGHDLAETIRSWRNK